ncbi:putative acetyltransferase [uncultured Gammaproteobacteria bacterium]
MRITAERPEHAPAIEALLDLTFGPGRHTKTVYRLRENIDPVEGLSFVALDHDVLQGTIRYWPVLIAQTTPALLLGPIAVTPARQSGGLGARLMRHSLAQAAITGHRIVLLVGDEPYYRRFGFSRRPVLALELPGPVDTNRFLGLELTKGTLHGISGTVGPSGPTAKLLHTTHATTYAQVRTP